MTNTTTTWVWANEIVGTTLPLTYQVTSVDGGRYIYHMNLVAAAIEPDQYDDEYLPLHEDEPN